MPLDLEPRLTAEIIATCNAIGSLDEDEYIKGPECLESVKDLVLYLRRDDDDHSVRRLLGQTQVVQKDLLPLVKAHHQDRELFDVLLRLLVNLTNSPILLYEENIPKYAEKRKIYMEITQQLQSYMDAFADEIVWKNIVERLEALLKMDWDNLLEDHKLNLERMLVLIRNVLQVPSDPIGEKRASNDASNHDRILWAMHQAGLDRLLISIASSYSTQDYCLHVLEIVSLMFRDLSGEEIAKSNEDRTVADKIREEKELMECREKEAIQKSLQMQKLSSRHSRFGGTFTVRDLKAPSGNDLLCHKPINSIGDLSLDAGKKKRKIGRNRRLVEETSTRRSTLKIRCFLKEFCNEFLGSVYNTIMKIVKNNIVRTRTQENDETYYLWAMKFFMEFNRHFNFALVLVKETMSKSNFHYVQTLLDKYHEMMKTDKEKIVYWSKRAHVALRAYQELFYTLLWMDKSRDETTRESSRSIKDLVFIQPEYRDLSVSLLSAFNPIKLSMSYLKDLIETNHLFLKMLEDYLKQCPEVKVKVKKRKRNKKNAKGSLEKKRKEGETENPNIQEMWDGVSSNVEAALLSTELPDETCNVLPFDAASDVPIDNQKSTAVERIAVFLHTDKLVEAVTLLRASREVWPENMDEFGEPNAGPHDEIFILKSIFLEQWDVVSDRVKAHSENTKENKNEQERNEDEEPSRNSHDEIESEEEEDEKPRVVDERLDFRGFLECYANLKIISNYGMAFQNWESLSPLTLHCIMKMFHRLAFDMGYPALICQATIFITFRKIIPLSIVHPHLKEVHKFFLHFWPKFTKMCEGNDKMFIEILFWKTRQEATEIQEGYGAYENKTKRSKISKFDLTEEDENMVVILGKEYLALPSEEKKRVKIFDWINEKLPSGKKTKKTIMNKLYEKEVLIKTIRGKKRNVGEETTNMRLSPPRTESENEDNDEEFLRMIKEKFAEKNKELEISGSQKIKKKPKKKETKQTKNQMKDSESYMEEEKDEIEKEDDEISIILSESEDDEAVKINLNKSSKQRKSRILANSDSSESENEDSKNERVPESPISKSPISGRMSVSSPDLEEEKENFPLRAKKNLTRLIHDSSSSESEEENEESTGKNKGVEPEGEIDARVEEEKEKGNVEDSDEEEAVGSRRKVGRKSAHIIDSNDEDD